MPWNRFWGSRSVLPYEPCHKYWGSCNSATSPYLPCGNRSQQLSQVPDSCSLVEAMAGLLQLKETLDMFDMLRWAVEEGIISRDMNVLQASLSIATSRSLLHFRPFHCRRLEFTSTETNSREQDRYAAMQMKGLQFICLWRLPFSCILINSRDTTFEKTWKDKMHSVVRCLHSGAATAIEGATVYWQYQLSRCQIPKTEEIKRWPNSPIVLVFLRFCSDILKLFQHFISKTSRCKQAKFGSLNHVHFFAQ